MKKPEIIILVGNIGSGKSTVIKDLHAEGLSHIVISRDALRYMIGSGTYRFDLKLEDSIWRSEIKIIEVFMRKNINLIIDEVGVSKQMRKRYIDLAKKYNYRVTILEMPRYDKTFCVDRRINSPHGQFSREVWESIWDKFNYLYEKPSKKEGINRIITISKRKKLCQIIKN